MTDQPIPGDDLTVIKGIKDTRQQLLREDLGIETFAALASAPAERIYAAFRAKGLPVSHATIEQWIEEARQRADAPQYAADREARPAQAGTWSAVAQFSVIVQGRTTAEGSVEYRTSAYHQEADEDQYWAGADLNAAVEWLRARLDTLMGPLPEASVELAVETPALPDLAALSTQLHEQLARFGIREDTLPEDVPPAAAAPPALLGAQDPGATSRLQEYLARYGTGETVVPTAQVASPQAASSAAPQQAASPAPLPPAQNADNARLQQLLHKYGWR